jgi:hypothetical protein
MQRAFAARLGSRQNASRRTCSELLYHDLREEFGSTAQAVIRCLAKVADAFNTREAKWTCPVRPSMRRNGTTTARFGSWPATRCPGGFPERHPSAMRPSLPPGKRRLANHARWIPRKGPKRSSGSSRRWASRDTPQEVRSRGAGQRPDQATICLATSPAATTSRVKRASGGERLFGAFIIC